MDDLHGRLVSWRHWSRVTLSGSSSLISTNASALIFSTTQAGIGGRGSRGQEEGQLTPWWCCSGARAASWVAKASISASDGTLACGGRVEGPTPGV